MSAYISTILTKLMENHGLSSTELARLTGVVQPVIYRIASGETDNPKIETLIPLANYFGITINELIGVNLPEKNKTRSLSIFNEVPLLNWDQLATLPNLQNIKISNYTNSHIKLSKSSFAIKLTNDVFNPKFLKDSILFFEIELKPENLDFVLIKFLEQKEITLKQILMDAADTYLKPINPDLRVIFMENKNKFEILGVLVESITTYRE